MPTQNKKKNPVKYHLFSDKKNYSTLLLNTIYFNKDFFFSNTYYFSFKMRSFFLKMNIFRYMNNYIQHMQRLYKKIVKLKVFSLLYFIL